MRAWCLCSRYVFYLSNMDMSLVSRSHRNGESGKPGARLLRVRSRGGPPLYHGAALICMCLCSNFTADP